MDNDILLSIVYFYSASAAACDLTIGLLPIFLIWNLRVSRRTKTGVAVLLGIGCMCV
jgi:outer membrane receptor for Fe3+-dicitrate